MRAQMRLVRPGFSLMSLFALGVVVDSRGAERLPTHRLPVSQSPMIGKRTRVG